MIRILVLAFLIIFLYAERLHNLSRTIYYRVISYTMVLVYHKKSSDLVKGVFLGLVDVLFTTFSWFSGTVWFRSDFQFRITGGFIFCSNIEYVWETFRLESASFPLLFKCRLWLVKNFLSLSISKSDVCYCTFTIFFSFLLSDIISFFTR
jgi:hypothetical protein